MKKVIPFRRIFIFQLLFLIVITCHPGIVSAKSSPDDNSMLTEARNLAKRVLGDRAGEFVFKRLENDTARNAFELSAWGKKIVIRGNSGIDLASGLNWYLKNYCNAQFTVIDSHIDLPEKLPMPIETIRIRTPYQYRYFFNVCTFGYTMAWWGWEEWERQIDWMAMNGINLPLAITGQEAVWHEVYRELGLKEEQIVGFITGPAYFPWGWMGNVDGFGGPLPGSWEESHKELQKKIVNRERALGMSPVLQGFTGHVPESLVKIFPQAKIHKTGKWSAGFDGTWFLDPNDELFQRIGRLFIEKQTALYGTSHFYSADCFNEVDPDTNDTAFLARMSRSVYNAMASADPSAVWVMQAWFLYYQKDFWKEPQSRAFIGAVPDDKLILLDLWSERFPVWKSQKSFYGKPWVWNVLYNFGGRTCMSGNIKAMADNYKTVLESPEKGNFSGIGMTMEYFGNNPVIEEFVMDRVWNSGVPDTREWIVNYARDRYGKKNEHAEKAWQGMLATVYNTHKQNGMFCCERPGFYDPKQAYRSGPVISYSQDTLINALEELLSCPAEFQKQETWQFDLVNLVRQVLSPLSLKWIKETEKAYHEKDLDKIRKYRQLFFGLITDLDDLLATRKEYLLGSWIEEAKSWGNTQAEKELYEWNAKNQITLWGNECTEGQNDDLNNYALKQWSGMFRSYHLVRWTKFFDELESSVQKNQEWDRSRFYSESCEWEKSWCRQHEQFPLQPKGDPVSTARRIWDKYRGSF
ncbi:MAG: alpha-N-acetylglucosaminidase [Bacteroidetes bacterium]|nr:alpha-N-acetylglucosaminidase [Bacteroidota bacterium]